LTTGKTNYQLLANHLQKPEIMTNPDLVGDLYVFESAIFFFNKNNLWAIADKGVNDATILAITKKINGGINGLSDRASLTKRYYSWLKTT
jgi:putative chitinase